MSQQHSNDKKLTTIKGLPPLARAAALGHLLTHEYLNSSLFADVQNQLLTLARNGGCVGWRGAIDRLVRSGTNVGAVVAALHRWITGIDPLQLAAAVRLRALTELIATCDYERALCQTLRIEFNSELLHRAVVAAQKRGPAQRESVVAFIASAPEFYDTLTPLLVDNDENVRSAACEVLTSPTGCGERYITLCLRTLEEDVDPSVRRAAAVGYLRNMPAVAPTHLSNGAVEAVRSILRFSPFAQGASAAVRLLNDERFRRACLDRIARLSTSTQRDAALRSWHLMLIPARRQALQSLGTFNVILQRANSGLRCVIGQRGLFPATAEVNGVTSDRCAARGFIQASATLPAPARETLLAPMLSATDASLRLAAVQHAPASLLADFAFDANPDVASAAGVRWLTTSKARRAAVSTEVNSHLARSPHAALRAMVPKQTWQTPVRQNISIQDAVSVVLDTSKSPRERAVAASALRQESNSLDVVLNILPRVLQEYQQGSKSESSVLMFDQSPADARVVSNLVDVAARSIRIQTPASQQKRQLASCLIELKGAGIHQRLRASTVQALCATGDISNDELYYDLLGLLRDPRPAHRISGAWLAGRIAAYSKVNPSVSPHGTSLHGEVLSELTHAASVQHAYRAKHAMLAWKFHALHCRGVPGVTSTVWAA